MPFDGTIDGNLDKANMCGLPLSSFELTPQYSLESNSASAASPSNIVPDPQSFSFITNYGNKGIGGECGNSLVSQNVPHSNPNLYDIEETLSESGHNLPDCASTLKSKAIKRVNLVKPSNSTILAILNEEDEV